MRPIPVPKHVAEAEWVEQTMVYAAPSGDLTDNVIPPAEGIWYTAEMEGVGVVPMVGVLLRFDDDELEAIRAGRDVVLLMSWAGRQMPVFIVPQAIAIDEQE